MPHGQTDSLLHHLTLEVLYLSEIIICSHGQFVEQNSYVPHQLTIDPPNLNSSKGIRMIRALHRNLAAITEESEVNLWCTSCTGRRDINMGIFVISPHTQTKNTNDTKYLTPKSIHKSIPWKSIPWKSTLAPRTFGIWGRSFEGAGAGTSTRGGSGECGMPGSSPAASDGHLAIWA